ncbi:hypothetical protein [Nakamurella sp.]|uniref:hypothetical protein n=1 Tax=Nakamurella sp. TaxID=1869182 RepID=UPI003783F9A3
MSTGTTDPLASLHDGVDPDDPQDLAALRPYVVNLTRGLLSTDGVMQTPIEDVDAIFDEHLPRFIADRAAQGWDGPVPVVFWAHGGIVSESAGLRIAGQQVPWWRDNGCYPIHFVWETGLSDTLLSVASLIRSMQPTGGRGAPWWSVKVSAQVASRPGGGAYAVAQRLVRFCAENPGRITVHAAGHSAGAIFHSRFVPAVVALGGSSGPTFGTLQLLAPALRVDDFSSTLLPLVGAGVDSLVLYTMTDAAEQADSCFRVYRRSLLYLVSELFEDPTDSPLLGMEVAIRASRELLATFGLDPAEQRAAEVVWSPTPPDAPPGRRSMAVSHGGFDNDVDTMNSVAGRILGRAVATGFPPGRASASRLLLPRDDSWTP